MLKNITNTLGALLEGVEVITEKTVEMTVKSLDVIDVELDKTLAASKATKEQEIAQAVAEAEYSLQKSKLKLDGKLSALKRLAEEAEENI